MTILRESTSMSTRMWEMAKSIRDNGTRKQEKEMEWESSFGLMGQSTRVCGEETEQMAEVE
jgi:hypothetical protein